MMVVHPILQSVASLGIRLGLERFTDFLEYIGNPTQNYPAFHIAGTNGKGSVTRIIESILTVEGYRVGVFTSPHLQHINERITLNGTPISDEELDEILQHIYPLAKQWAATEYGVTEEEPLTYFELITACALFYFAKSRVDVVVIEVGMGGRHDATTVVNSMVSAIVSIGFDHMAHLGHDLASIAAEKAGIIKPNTPVVTGRLPPEAHRVIRVMAADQDSGLFTLDSEFQVQQHTNGYFDFSFGQFGQRDLAINLLGSHQRFNAGVALACLQLTKNHFPVTDDSVRQGLLSVVHPGRLEWLSENILADCAHNLDGARQLAEYLSNLPRRLPRVLLFGVSSDKDARSIVSPLVPHIDRILTTFCRHPRSLEALSLAQELEHLDIPVEAVGTIENALAHINSESEMVIVAGSVFLVGAARDLIE